MAKSYIPVLSIAGSDCSGGAGIQADIKTISALGCYAMTAITAVTVQNTLGVQAIQLIDPALVGEQIDAVFADIRPLAVKIGMIGSTDIAVEIAAALKRNNATNVVVDPVIYSTSGSNLAGTDARTAIIDNLFPIADLITPNLDEACSLSGIWDDDSITKIGERLREIGAANVLITGVSNKFNRSLLNDYFFCSRLCDGEPKKIMGAYGSRAVNTSNTHGTGCTLSSAIAAELAKGHEMMDAIKIAHDYVFTAITEGADINIGQGHGPVNHFFEPQKLITK